MLIYKSAAAAAWLGSADDDELVLIFPSFHESHEEAPRKKAGQCRRVLYFY